jgi:hypothetical protein
MKLLRIILPVAVVALLIWGWVYFHPSPERLIRKQLDGAAHAAAFSPGQGYLDKMANAEVLADFVTTNAQVKMDLPENHPHQLSGRDEIQQAALAARAAVQSVSVYLPDVHIELGADQNSAVADVTLEVVIAGEKDLIKQEVKANFRKIGGEWLIENVETVRTLH